MSEFFLCVRRLATGLKNTRQTMQPKWIWRESADGTEQALL